MSNKQDLQTAVESLTKARKEAAKEVSEAIEITQQTRKEQTEQSNRQD